MKGERYGKPLVVQVRQNIVLNNPPINQVQDALKSNSVSVPVALYSDSGSDANLINASLPRSLKLELLKIPFPLEVNAVDGSNLAK